MGFEIGNRVKMTEEGIEKWGDQSGGGEGLVVGKVDGDESWTDVAWDNGHCNNYEDGDIVVVAQAAPAVEAEQAPEQKEVAERVKYLYSVQEDGVSIMTTSDRDYAREVKAYLGGKKEGVIIMAYAPVKEIR